MLKLILPTLLLSLSADLMAIIGDADNDGIPDRIELQQGRPVDTDLDGIPDYLDTDSDNDGIPDSLEGAIDANGNGIPDYIEITSDGDADFDGIPDSVEGLSDFDGDGVANHLDLDADNDGLPDSLEVASAVSGVDSDNDKTPDYLDRDSDNDGISDAVESGAIDLNQDGFLDGFIDLDGNGLHDDISVSAQVQRDPDGDGILNHVDLDADGDGDFDVVEIGGQDSDGDGLLDAWMDSDQDGIPDYADADWQGGADTDLDGIVDFADIDTYPLGSDTDEDGIEDSFDLDSNASGFITWLVQEPSLGAALPDSDGDGVLDFLQPEISSVNGAANEAGKGESVSGGSSGCSIAGHIAPAVEGAAFHDPTLAVLLFATMIKLFRDLLRRRPMARL